MQRNLLLQFVSDLGEKIASLTGLIDDMQLYLLMKSISVILGDVRVIIIKGCLQSNECPPPAGFKPSPARSASQR